VRVAPEKLACAGAAPPGSQYTGFASGAVGVAGIDQHDADSMLTALQMALSDDQRRGNDFVAGEHGSGGHRLVGYRTSEIGFTTGLQTGAYGGEGKAARHFIITNQGSGRRINHEAFTLSRNPIMITTTQQSREFHAPAEFLSMRNVDIARGQKVVLQDINLTIATGEHLAILGPNGCGKSTLIKAMTCECYPIIRTGMEMKVYGRDRWEVQELRKHLGVVASELPGERTSVTRGLDAVVSGFFSSSTLWPNLEVTEPMRTSAMDALGLLGAGYLRDRFVGEMSAGEKRRVMIARALVHRPEMLLLDEPSNALDLPAQRELREILRAVAVGSKDRRGTGIVMVTHHLADILPEIDRVVMMKGGRIFADGPKTELLQAEKLEDLFGVELELTERHGYWHSW
jgi:iron complex transport system ATP-binding protein